jgi:hypothetical protein
MQLDDYVHQVRDSLTAAAALGDDRVREVAESLATAASPAIRLAILTALAEAADEVTTALLDTADAPVVAIHVEVDEIRVEVTNTRPDSGPSSRGDDGDASARISMRLSDALKSDIDAAATREGISVNTWLVRAASAALSGPLSGPAAANRNRHGTNTHRVTGWING